MTYRRIEIQSNACGLSNFLWLGAISTLNISYMYTILWLGYVLTAILASAFLGKHQPYSLDLNYLSVVRMHFDHEEHKTLRGVYII
jgi:hypothetical protein